MLNAITYLNFAQNFKRVIKIIKNNCWYVKNVL